MNNEKLYLVLNLGLKSIRAIVFNIEGKTMFSSYLPIKTMIREEWVEQNPNEWWEKTQILFLKISDKKSIANKIFGLTVTSSSACLVPVDEKLEPTFNSIMVSDKRAKNEAKKISALREFQRIRRDTGMDISAYYMLSKLIWLKNNEPSKYKKAKFFLSPNDYLIAKLTGKVVTDVFNAQKFHFNTITNSYPIELLKKLKIDYLSFAPVSNPGEIVGTLKRNLITKFHFPKDLIVVLATYDAICAFFGSGPGKEGLACDVSGTVTSVRTSTYKKINKNFENIFCSFLKNYNLNIIGASNNLGGGLIEWAKQSFYTENNDPYEIMEKEASLSEVGARGLLFLPYLMGERAPIWDNDVRGIFWGIERIHTRKDFIRAVFESTAFITKDLINEIEKNNIKINTIRTSGGLSRIKLISQLKADITGKKVELLKETETTALGALFFLLLGLKIYPDFNSMVTKLVKIDKIFIPNKENHAKYEDIFLLYKMLYFRSKSLFKIRKKIMKTVYSNTFYKVENL